jgi:hypothetical protein
MEKLTSILVAIDQNDDARHVVEKAMMLGRCCHASVERPLVDGAVCRHCRRLLT